MKRLAALVVLVACNFSPAPPIAHDASLSPGSASDASAPLDVRPATIADAAPTRAVESTPPAPVAPAAVEPIPPPGGVVVAAPSQEMRALAVMADGAAAVSSDIGGSVRLWPTLDGTREPVVVAMRRPVALAITHRLDGLAIAGIDGAGQLEIVHTSAFGAPIDSVEIALARPAMAVHANKAGFLIERDDQHLVFVAADGEVMGELEPPAGSHVAAIAARDDAMLAILDDGRAVHGRWIEITGTMRWGDETGALPIAAGAVSLSPDHKSIAAMTIAPGPRLALVDLADGARMVLGSEVISTLDPLGFVAADTVLVRGEGFLGMWHATADAPVTDIDERSRSPVAAVGGTHGVIGLGSVLRLVDASGESRFLGFRVPRPAEVVGAVGSLLMSDGQNLMRLGLDLRVRATYALPSVDRGRVTLAAILDATHVVIQTYTTSNHVAILTLDGRDATPLDEQSIEAYEPVSHIAAFVKRDAVHFRRFDPKTGTFGPAAAIARSGASVVLAPGPTGGSATASLTTYDEATFTQETLSVRPERMTNPVRVMRASTGTLTFDGEAPAPAPPPAAAAPVHRSPDGMLVAVNDGARVTLRDKAGAVKWTLPANGTTDVSWLASGELVAFGAGLEVIDAATGAITQRRCGWQFGLWDDRPETLGSSQLCEAEIVPPSHS